MKIGLISDTHNRLPAEVHKTFSGVDLIFHAGDIGSEEILTELNSIAPVRAIYGNMDTFPLMGQLKRIDFHTINGKTFCLTHSIGSPRDFTFQLFKMNRETDAVIYGHSHIAEHTIYQNIHFINPGSASKPKTSMGGSVGILTITGDELKIEFVYLKK